MKTRKRIKPVSNARRAENKIRGAVLADVLMRDGYRCKVRDYLPDVFCLGRLTGHELLSRGRGGSIINPANIVAACERHNGYLHDNPEKAHALGLLKHAWEAPELSRANDANLGLSDGLVEEADAESGTDAVPVF